MASECALHVTLTVAWPTQGGILTFISPWRIGAGGLWAGCGGPAEVVVGGAGLLVVFEADAEVFEVLGAEEPLLCDVCAPGPEPTSIDVALPELGCGAPPAFTGEADDPDDGGDTLLLLPLVPLDVCPLLVAPLVSLPAGSDPAPGFAPESGSPTREDPFAAGRSLPVPPSTIAIVARMSAATVAAEITAIRLP